MVVSNSPDSSTQLPLVAPPPANDDAAPRGPAMSDKARLALLREGRTIGGIKKIARKLKVLEQDHEDILQETSKRTLTAWIPEDVSDGRKVVYGIAFNVCSEHRRVPLADVFSEEPDEEHGVEASKASVEQPPIEVRDGLERLTAKGRERFGERFDEYARARAAEETSKETAERRGIGQEAQRKESSRIEEFMRKHGRAMGLLVAASLVVLVVAAIPMSRWSRTPMLGPNDMSERASTAHEAPPPDAKALRQRAADACADAAWEACLADLDAAAKLDPSGETAEMLQLRQDAERELAVHDSAEEPEFYNAKPPLRGPTRPQRQQR